MIYAFRRIFRSRKICSRSRAIRAHTSCRRTGRLTMRSARCWRRQARKLFPTFRMTLIWCAPRQALRMESAADGFSVIPYEPYYKISSAPVAIVQKTSAWSPHEKPCYQWTTLLDLAVNQKPLPSGTYLTLGLFSDNAAATIGQIEKLGGKILSARPFAVRPGRACAAAEDWTALATLSGVQIVEPAQRVQANDLSARDRRRFHRHITNVGITRTLTHRQ